MNAGGNGAGQAGTGGSPLGSGGTLMLGNSPAEACIAYGLAVCSRQVQCSNGSLEVWPVPSCIAVTYECPDLSFSPGATRTVAGLLACAEDYKTWPCDKVKADELPACVTPGERAQSERCVYNSECRGLSCESLGGCGQCARLAALDESCAAPDVDCVPGTYCSPEMTCEATGVGVTTPPPGPNEPCMVGNSCVKDYYCKGTVNQAVCAPLPEINDSCLEINACASGAYCAADYTCKAMPAMGEPCGQGAFGGFPNACQDKLVCHHAPDGLSGTCLPYPKAGEPCVLMPPTMPEYGLCGPGLGCDMSQSPPQCLAPGKPGDGCGSGRACEGYARCQCPEGEPNCTERKCVGLRFAGERCDEPNYVCHPAFSCTAGVCQPIVLQGKFAETCGN